MTSERSPRLSPSGPRLSCEAECPTGPTGSTFIENAGGSAGTGLTNIPILVPAPAGNFFTLIEDFQFREGEDNNLFTHSDGILTYIGTNPQRFLVSGHISGVVSDPLINVFLAFARNGQLVNDPLNVQDASSGLNVFDIPDSRQVSFSDWVLLNPQDFIQLATKTSPPSDLQIVVASIAIG